MAKKQEKKETKPKNTAAREYEGTKSRRSGRESEKGKEKASAASREYTAPARAAREEKPYNANAPLNVMAPYLLTFIGLFMLVTFLWHGKMNFIGKMTEWLYGLVSYGLWLVPPALLLVAYRWKYDAPKKLVRYRLVFMVLCVVFFSAFMNLVLVDPENLVFDIPELFVNGTRLIGGGVFGGLICLALFKLTGGVGTAIITVFLTLLCGFLMFGITFSDLWYMFKGKAHEAYYDVKAAREQRKEEEEDKRLRREEKERILRERSEGGEASEEEPAAGKSGKPGKTGRRSDSSDGVHELSIEEQDEYEKDLSIDEGGEESRGKKKKSRAKDIINDFLEEFDKTEKEVVECDADDELEPEKTGLEKDYTVPDEKVFDELCEESGVDLADANVVSAASAGSALSGDVGFDDIFTDDAFIAGAGTVIRPGKLGQSESTEQSLSADAVTGERTEGLEEPAEEEDFGLEDAEDAEEIDLEKSYEFPPLALLPGNPNPSVFAVTDELKETATSLVTTLASFKVRTKVMNISCGPTVTRYELKPDVGVKVSSIQNLANDIALHLRASSVRIEAPIPGKDAVGIEIPNKEVSTVYIRELIDRQDFRDLKSRLSVALGMDVSGSPVYMDIAKMPHLLIAGATGMGKSVCINSFIISILYKARPDEVKLILIDPKKVEFSMYDRIPHLLVPVVTDPKRAAGTLAWAVNEMEHRFSLIEAAKCRDIKSFNAVCEKQPELGLRKMSQIVIIIDELADLMMTSRDEVENSICRLAQKARAAGMHLIIGTQRPSVDVITGVIKANIPSRIAFTVASQVDSRTIIDVAGAENLVGKGDMLFAPVGSMKPTRVQGSFVGSDDVIEAITDYLRASGLTSYDSSIDEAIDKEAARCSEKKKGKGSAADSEETYVGSTSDFSRDDMMLPALELGVEMGQISTSLIQRKLSLGYARAARIVDMLAEMGYVGPFEGSKPRKVIINHTELMQIKQEQNIDG